MTQSRDNTRSAQRNTPPTGRGDMIRLLDFWNTRNSESVCCETLITKTAQEIHKEFEACVNGPLHMCRIQDLCSLVGERGFWPGIPVLKERITDHGLDVDTAFASTFPGRNLTAEDDRQRFEDLCLVEEALDDRKFLHVVCFLHLKEIFLRPQDTTGLMLFFENRFRDPQDFLVRVLQDVQSIGANMVFHELKTLVLGPFQQVRYDPLANPQARNVIITQSHAHILHVLMCGIEHLLAGPLLHTCWGLNTPPHLAVGILLSPETPLGRFPDGPSSLGPLVLPGGQTAHERVHVQRLRQNIQKHRPEHIFHLLSRLHSLMKQRKQTPETYNFHLEKP